MHSKRSCGVGLGNRLGHTPSIFSGSPYTKWSPLEAWHQLFCIQIWMSKPCNFNGPWTTAQAMDWTIPIAGNLAARVSFIISWHSLSKNVVVANGYATFWGLHVSSKLYWGHAGHDRMAKMKTTWGDKVNSSAFFQLGHDSADNSVVSLEVEWTCHVGMLAILDPFPPKWTTRVQRERTYGLLEWTTILPQQDMLVLGHAQW